MFRLIPTVNDYSQDDTRRFPGGLGCVSRQMGGGRDSLILPWTIPDAVVTGGTVHEP